MNLSIGAARIGEKQAGFFLIKIFVLVFACACVWSLYAHVFMCGGQKLTPGFFLCHFPLIHRGRVWLPSWLQAFPICSPEPRDSEQTRQASIWDWRIGTSALKLVWHCSPHGTISLTAEHAKQSLSVNDTSKLARQCRVLGRDWGRQT